MQTTPRIKPTEYDLQATAFCKATGLEIEKDYTGHRFYFDGDKQQRAVWSITFIRKGKNSYTFELGASILDSYRIPWRPGNYDEITVSKALMLRGADKILAAGGGVIQGRYELSPKKPKTPTDYDILSRVEKSGLCSFSDFCDSYGYNSDSIKARDTWQGQ